MLVTFDAAAERGRQFTISLADGTKLAGVSLGTILGALQAAGYSIRKAAAVVAEARIAAASSQATA